MVITLGIIGILVLLISFIAGIMTGSFLGFLTAIGGGIASATVFFALSKILTNQEIILYKLQYVESTKKNTYIQEKKACSRCNKQYDIDMNSCPHCGQRYNL
jgi:uncharacterized membrane protein YdjX (TVP38/TMEM64 family)